MSFNDGYLIESQWATAGRTGLAAAFGSDGFQYVRRDRHTGAIAEEKQDREYWIWALAAALVLLGLEVFLGQRFGHYGSARPTGAA